MMAKRSLQASPEGIKQAKLAFTSKGWTQADLAREVGLKTRQPIGRFFGGKPIDRQAFIELCFLLDLHWQEIAESAKDGVASQQESRYDGDDIETLVAWVRSRLSDKIQHQCKGIRLLDIAQSVNLEDIYVETRVLVRPVAQQWLELSDLQDFNPDAECFDLPGVEESIPAMEAVARWHKLMVLGKPGAGKTTFLQYLGFCCQQNSDRLPVFIRLKDFAADTKIARVSQVTTENGFLLDYISQELSTIGISEQELKKMLLAGKMLILLDGLDEVKQQDREIVQQQIRVLSGKYYQNHWAIAARTSAISYHFEGFNSVEIADFNQGQIEEFARKWFVAVANPNRQAGAQKASQFIEKLAQPENQPIRELASNPLLLHLACLVFDAKAEFPNQRSSFYEEALEIFLYKWDAAKGLERDGFYQNLSVAQKIKLLTELAAIAFERGNYFCDRAELEQDIADYLRGLPDAETDVVALQQASRSVIEAIAVQQGFLVERARRIYSFSHQAFQAYLTAIKIAHSGLPALQQLASHVGEKRWREVFLNVATLLPNTDPLWQQMKQQINLLVSDETLQQFIFWVCQKSWSVQVNPNSAAVRAFYFALALAIDYYWVVILRSRASIFYFPLSVYLALAQTLDPNLALTPNWDFAIDFATQVKAIDSSIDPLLQRFFLLELVLNCSLNFDLILERNLGLELQSLLQVLKAKLPQAAQDSPDFQAWWQANGEDWTAEFKALLKEHQYVGHDWQFSHHQKQMLQQYYEANKLLIDCLNSKAKVTQEMRQQIQETLLLPV